MDQESVSSSCQRTHSNSRAFNASVSDNTRSPSARSTLATTTHRICPTARLTDSDSHRLFAPLVHPNSRSRISRNTLFPLRRTSVISSWRAPSPLTHSITLDPLHTPVPNPFCAEYDRSSTARPPRSLLEQAMARMSAAIRNQADWRSNRHDMLSSSKWKQEATDSNPSLTPAAVQYVLDELDHYDALLDRETGIEMSTVDGVWQSDSLPPDGLIAQLKQAVQECWGHESAEQRDWHPGSGRQVWDMVHPSLYCLVAGRTRVVAEDIPLDRSLGMMCSGRVLSEAQYGRQLKQRTAATVARERSQRAHLTCSPEEKNDEKAVKMQKLVQTFAEKQVEWSEAEDASEWKEAWEVGKISLWVWTGGIGVGDRFTLYVKPDATLVDVRREVAANLPEDYGAWTLSCLGRAIRPKDETKPLYQLSMHSTTQFGANAEQTSRHRVAERIRRTSAAMLKHRKEDAARP